MTPVSREPDAAPKAPSYSLWQLVRYMLHPLMTHA
jgi:hypothetical protein